MINFNSNKIIIVCFPEGAGGKFLINCLGLSNSCVFQHAELANLQLDGNFTLQDKLAYLHDKLNNMTEIWNDLDLHTPYLFGINAGEHMNKSTVDISYNSIIETITNLNQHYLFITSHEIEYAESCINIWPNAQIILFENAKKFISGRTFKDTIKSTTFDNWSAIRGEDWPIDPPKSTQELESLPLDVINELKTNFGNPYVHYYSELSRSQYKIKKQEEFKRKHIKNIMVWNTDWYFSLTDTLTEIGNLYNKLNLSGYDPIAISSYYDSWASKLKIQLPHHAD